MSGPPQAGEEGGEEEDEGYEDRQGGFEREDGGEVPPAAAGGDGAEGVAVVDALGVLGADAEQAGRPLGEAGAGALDGEQGPLEEPEPVADMEGGAVVDVGAERGAAALGVVAAVGDAVGEVEEAEGDEEGEAEVEQAADCRRSRPRGERDRGGGGGEEQDPGELGRERQAEGGAEGGGA